MLETGLRLLPDALLNALMSPITGRLHDKFVAKGLVMVGLLFTIHAIWGSTSLSETTSYS